VRLRVDPLKCQGHARCFALLPELFEVDDYGMSSVKGDGTVPASLEERGQLAIANCPEFAIEEITEGADPDLEVPSQPGDRVLGQ
jgi:ferredoxin